MAATPVVGHPRLPQLACSLSAALTALQPHWLPPLQCSLPADTIAAQPHWRSSLPCPPTCGAASWLPHHCSTASFPLTPRTSPVAPGVGYWSRSRRGHHRAAHGASPGLVLPNLCIAAENFAALSPPSGVLLDISSSGISSAHGEKPGCICLGVRLLLRLLPSRSGLPQVYPSPRELAISSTSVV